MKPPTNLLDYYAQLGPVTDPKEHAGMLDGLPHEIGALVETLQGLLIHLFWVKRYGVTLPKEREQEVNLRAVPRQLARMRELDDAPLTKARPLDKKLVGNCRDFSTLLCAMLRHQGIPARARCGFGTYFTPGRYEDHWVCEYWRKDQRRWVMVDAQLDALQRKTLGIRFDPLDMPAGAFVLGGQAWLMCRAGQANPDHFGIFNMHGLSFVRGDLMRDVLALNKIEILPWDPWNLMTRLEEDGLQDAELIDRLARLSIGGDAEIAELRAFYERDPRLRAPEGWKP